MTIWRTYDLGGSSSIAAYHHPYIISSTATATATATATIYQAFRIFALLCAYKCNVICSCAKNMFVKITGRSSVTCITQSGTRFVADVVGFIVSFQFHAI